MCLTFIASATETREALIPFFASPVVSASVIKSASRELRSRVAMCARLVCGGSGVAVAVSAAFGASFCICRLSFWQPTANRGQPTTNNEPTTVDSKFAINEYKAGASLVVIVAADEVVVCTCRRVRQAFEQQTLDVLSPNAQKKLKFKQALSEKPSC